ncbi:MAG: 5'/3'-nucleotidase SurE [Gemmatimonadota bacterium]|nr:5'/3'-nucleotidase SurE [Gemmatimonadota bacterium]
MSSPRILISNDDGILARGLRILEMAAAPLGELYVVAPDREQSATSHSLTLHHPLRPVQLDPRRWQVDGTPTDCVMLACATLLPGRPDFVLSGINHGPNMGEDVLYSGTVAAAMEGLVLGIPSIAISFAGKVLLEDTLLAAQAEALSTLLQHITTLPKFPADTLLNINLPAVAAAEIKGVKLTRLGRRVFSDSVTHMKDPWGRDIVWLGGGTVNWTGPADSDFRAVADGYISVTPLQFDLTHRDVLATAEEWWRNP